MHAIYSVGLGKRKNQYVLMIAKPVLYMFLSFTFKGQATDLEEKCKELMRAVEELRGLLKEASSSYTELRSQHQSDVERLNVELVDRGKGLIIVECSVCVWLFTTYLHVMYMCCFFWGGVWSMWSWWTEVKLQRYWNLVLNCLLETCMCCTCIGWGC